MLVATGAPCLGRSSKAQQGNGQQGSDQQAPQRDPNRQSSPWADSSDLPAPTCLPYLLRGKQKEHLVAARHRLPLSGQCSGVVLSPGWGGSQWTERQSEDRKVAGSIPSQGTGLG